MPFCDRRQFVRFIRSLYKLRNAIGNNDERKMEQKGRKEHISAHSKENYTDYTRGIITFANSLYN